MLEGIWGSNHFARMRTFVHWLLSRSIILGWVHTMNVVKEWNSKTFMFRLWPSTMLGALSLSVWRNLTMPYQQRPCQGGLVTCWKQPEWTRTFSSLMPPAQLPVQCSQDSSVLLKFANLPTGQQQVEFSRNFINGICEDFNVYLLYLYQWSHSQCLFTKWMLVYINYCVN